MKLPLAVLATLLLTEQARLDVRIDATEARAVIARDWSGVAGSAAYRRLKERDSSFNRPIFEASSGPSSSSAEHEATSSGSIIAAVCGANTPIPRRTHEHFRQHLG
jgi:hypothetical protein